MKAVVIDDERPALREMQYFLEKNHVEVIGAFLSPSEGYEFMLQTSPDVVFLDIDMPEMDGLELGVKLYQELPHIAIVYVTAYPQYSLEAYKSYPVDFILKPIDEARFASTVSRIRNNLISTQRVRIPALQIQCFGKFRVLVDGTPVKFTTNKARELFAYLLCSANHQTSRDEITDLVFGTGDPIRDSNHFRVTFYRLRNSLMAANIKKEHLFFAGDCSVYVADGICDYIDVQNFLARNKGIDTGNIDEAVAIIEKMESELLLDLDAVWITEFRENLAVQAEELILKAAMYLTAKENTEKAEKILLKLIGMNPLSDLGYLALLDLYLKTGMHDRFNFYYRRYAKLMIEEFDLPPDPRYTEMYNKYELGTDG